jgi:membrane protein YqaA with SNARE-associated domain
MVPVIRALACLLCCTVLCFGTDVTLEPRGLLSEDAINYAASAVATNILDSTRS